MRVPRNITTPTEFPKDSPDDFIRSIEELAQAANGGVEGGDAIFHDEGSAIDDLTNSTGGTADGTLVSIGDTSTSNEGSKINDNFTELNEKMDAVLAVFRDQGFIET